MDIIRKFTNVVIVISVLTAIKPLSFFPISPVTNAYGIVCSMRSSAITRLVIERHLNGLQTEYELLLSKYPDSGSGNITIRFLIEPTGEVSECTVVKTAFDNEPFERSIEKRIESWVFPEWDAGQCPVIITIEFCEINGPLPGTAIIDDIDYEHILKTYGVDGVHHMELENIRIKARRGMISTFDYTRRGINENDITSRLKEYYRQGVYRELSHTEPVKLYLKYKNVERDVITLKEKRDGEIGKLIDKKEDILTKTREMELAFDVEELGASAELTRKLDLPSTRGYDALCKKIKTYDLDSEELQRKYDTKLAEKEEALRGARLEVITSCEAALYDDNTEPDLGYISSYVLGELYTAAAEEKYEAAYNEWLESWKGVPRGERNPEPVPDYSKAISMYEAAVNENPDGPLNDVILYNLGFCHYSQGEKEVGAEVFYNLTKSYPDSELATETYFRIGEFWFNTYALGHYSKAIQYYENVPSSSNLYDEALYKTAWARYYTARYDDTETGYENVIGKSVQLINSTEEGTELYDEGIGLIAVSIAGLTDSHDEESAANDALGIFETLFEGVNQRPYSAEVLHRLADVYQYDYDRLDTAIILYEDLLTKYPLYERADEALSSCVTAHLNNEDHEGAHETRKWTVDDYGPNSEWFNTYDDLGFKITAVESWEKALYEIACYSHMMGERELDRRKDRPKSALYYDKAIERYSQYLAAFPANRKSYHVNFYLGMACDEAGERELAYENYLRTALGYEDRERYEIDKWDERFTKADVLFRGLISLDELSADLKAEKEVGESLYELALSTNDIPERPPAKPPVKEPSPIEEKIIYACDLFITEYPKAPETPIVLTYLGETYLSLRDYAKGRSCFERVLTEYVIKPDYYYGYSKREYNEFYTENLIKTGYSYYYEAVYFEGLGDIYFAGGSEYTTEVYHKSLGLYEEAKTVYEAAYELSSGYELPELTEETLEFKNAYRMKIDELKGKIEDLIK
jgi:tetratricopeptide (TPR) repeat protein